MATYLVDYAIAQHRNKTVKTVYIHLNYNELIGCFL